MATPSDSVGAIKLEPPESQGASGNVPITDAHADTAVLYPSPTPSSTPSLLACPVSSQAHKKSDDKGAVGFGARSAREYWKRKYAAASEKQQRPHRKRGSDGFAGSHNRTRKRQAIEGAAAAAVMQDPNPPATGNFGDVEPTALDVEEDDNDRNNSNKQMRLVKAGLSLDDPQARRDFDQLGQAASSFGEGKCRLEVVDGKQMWKLDGFGTSLYHHQVIGVSWMLSRELHPTAPRGGILADEMGLGKTVQVLACMSQNLPAKDSRATKTLIIAPKRLLCQWFQEIKRHCSHKRMQRVFIYAANRLMMDSQWADFDIILTNYAQLQLQLPSLAKLKEVERLRSKGDKKWKVLLRESSGSLFKVDWHRVVLDEAHHINNRSSRTSRACRLLVKRCSWVLTGTPVTNMPDEFFTYLDFIRSGYSNFGEYQKHMGNTGNDEQHRTLMETYHEVTLGRGVRDKLLGGPILQIPEDHATELRVEFSPLEKHLYQQIERKLNELRELARSSKATPANGLQRNRKGELHKLFNYLRYFTAHPALVEPGYLSRTQLQSNAQQSKDAEAPRVDAVAPTSDAQANEPSDEIQTDAATPRQSHCYCRLCRRALVQPMIAKCGHAFCKDCIRKIRLRGKHKHCLECGVIPTEFKEGGPECHHHNLDKFEKILNKFGGPGLTKTKRNKRVRKPGDDEFGLQPRLAQRSDTASKKRGARRNQKKVRGGKRGKGGESRANNNTTERIRTNAGNFLRLCDEKPWDPIPHSAKTQATLDLVKKWQEEAPDDKIIIFVQWVPVLSLLGRMLFQNGFRFVYLWGDMEANQHEMCIKAFEQVPEIKVMLISVTCGAHGLNLAAANRAIVFDHWWHEGWERQAFARILRIGQTKVVHTAKLVAAGSMDEAILAMQAAKRDSIKKAIGPRSKHPQYREICEALYEAGHLDKEELSELTRCDDVSDDSEGDDDDTDGRESGIDWGDESDDGDDDWDDSGSNASPGKSESADGYQPDSSGEAHDEAGEEGSSDDE